jgi:hypothetical protein
MVKKMTHASIDGTVPEPGMLFAVMGGTANDQVRRIVRIVEVRGAKALVQSDQELENDAAVEHDFPILDPAEFEVEIHQLRRVQERPERQAYINKLYSTFSDAGDDDLNARLRVADQVPHVTEAELDAAEAAYNAEED